MVLGKIGSVTNSRYSGGHSCCRSSGLSKSNYCWFGFFIFILD